MRTFTKVAVSIGGLRAANRAMSGKVIRRSIRVNPIEGTFGLSKHGPTPNMGPAGVRKELPKQLLDAHPKLKPMAGNAFIKGDPSRFTAKHVDPQLGERMNKLKPPDREVFNRTVWQHEGAETAVKAKAAAPFRGHAGVGPPLQDLNIAATLPKQYHGAAGAIRDMRKPEIDALRARHPTSFGRIDLGNERISRHARKRLIGTHKNGPAAPVIPPAPAAPPVKVPKKRWWHFGK